ncbi:hypothetical protein LOTGIDRAFT_177030 [Lottia gigantea]|uniref:Uncharacterized protein n=1 Tax=Lottia gigantea TaxID=225164 RepID=V4A2C4_LOTGI|nr:hypothetical protein LOTGIDRAFT_177030 [Lottia gigantea]XP_009051322.1 hypothetical protein LOTGIDRAFT_174489 [Lottia gigantea]ESO97998.1 hypothetical protein LOTGIDRAFT_174489 [Lottia gigantea]ESP02387.1 hypothetical protein LOTGIDRAFT_177030 [Lottia gigantea]
MKSYVDKRRNARETNLKVGDYVRTKRPVQRHKLQSTLSNPKSITQRLGKSSFRLSDGSCWNARRCIRAYQNHDHEENDQYPFYHNFDNVLPNDNVPPDIPNQNNRRNRNRVVPVRNHPQRIRHRPAYLNDYV